MAKRLFVDMDGTLAEWRSFKYEFTSLEEVQNANKLIYQRLNENDYFYNLKPQENVVEAIRELIKNDNDIDVYILSSVISDKAISDKNRWLDKYLPEIDYEHRIYSEDGKDKKDYIEGGVRSDDYLLDDRTLNLTLWEPPARGIKLLNGQNHTAGTWKGDMLTYINNPSMIAQKIVSIMNENEKVRDEQPFHMEQTITIKPLTVNAFENEELWEKEHAALKEQYLKIVNDRNFRALEWYTDLGGHYIFHPSNKDGDWQLSFIDHKGVPTSDSQYKKEDVGSGKLWKDPLMEFPHSKIGKNIDIKVLFNNPNRSNSTHGEERTMDMENIRAGHEKYGHEDIDDITYMANLLYYFKENKDAQLDTTVENIKKDLEDGKAAHYAQELLTYRENQRGKLVANDLAVLYELVQNLNSIERVSAENTVALPVAVESTKDYSDYFFRTNMNNTRGRRQEEYYRLVFVNDFGSLQPLDKQVFKSEEEALDYAQAKKGLYVVSYDAIVANAMIIRNKEEYRDIINSHNAELARLEKAMNLLGWESRADFGEETFWYKTGDRTADVEEKEFHNFAEMETFLQGIENEELDKLYEQGTENEYVSLVFGEEWAGKLTAARMFDELYYQQNKQEYIEKFGEGKEGRRKGVEKTFDDFTDGNVEVYVSRMKEMKGALETEEFDTLLEKIQSFFFVMPDESVGIEEMIKYEYTWDGMLPCKQERALELFEKNDLPVLKLYEDGTETYADSREDILNHEGMFGVEKDVWQGFLHPKTQEKTLATKDNVSFIVAECMEFHNLGVVHEDVPSIEEAVNLYAGMADGSTMIKGISVVINGNEYELVHENTIDSMEYYPEEIRNHEAVVYAKKVLTENKFIMQDVIKENNVHTEKEQTVFLTGGKIHEKSVGITVVIDNGAYYEGTWHVIDKTHENGCDLFLLEHDEYGDETACIIVDENNNVILEDVWNGFEDYMEQREWKIERYDMPEPIILTGEKGQEVIIDKYYKLPHNLSFVDGDDKKYQIFIAQDESLVLKTEDGEYISSGWLSAEHKSGYLELAATNFGKYQYEIFVEKAKENEKNAFFPIQEFYSKTTGKLLAGEEISGALAAERQGLSEGGFVFSSRREVYESVKEFETKNKVKNPVIDNDGNYEDKDFLYGAYDEYLGMSHREELKEYEPRFEAYLSKEEKHFSERGWNYDREGTLNSLLAEIYYAQKNGLSKEQIEAVIDDGMKSQWDMRAYRKTLEDGKSLEQLNLLKKYDSYIVDAINSYIPKDNQDIISFLGMESLVQDDVFVIADALKEGISYEQIKGVVSSFKDVKTWNSQNSNKLGFVDFQFGDMLSELAAKHNVTGEYIHEVTQKILQGLQDGTLKNSIYDEYKNFLLQNENSLEKGGNTMAKQNHSSTHGEEEKKSPKEQLQEVLEKGVKDILDSDGFANWCEKQGRLYYNHYSINNAILTWAQNPDASYVCGYEKWKDFGRQVKRGAQSIKIFAPVMAKETNGKGSLLAQIKKNCTAQLAADSTLEFATHKLGQSNLEFIMYKNGKLFDVKNNGKTLQSHLTSDQLRKFLDQYVIGKVPMYYTAVPVFDVKDTTSEVEYLWVSKDRVTKAEMVLDDNGKPVTDGRGNIKIRNSEERKARFEADLDMSIVEQSPDKMAILYDALKKVSEDRGVPVSEADKDKDETLSGGANGYYRHPYGEFPHGRIVISNDLTPTQRLRTLFHEMAHSDMHQDLNKLAAEMEVSNTEITRQMKEVQAEAVAFMSASAFGVKTEHKSFSYIAAWSGGRELETLKKSMTVIYNESQKLLKDIEKELDDRGLTMGLNVKDKTPLTQEERHAIVAPYKDFVLTSIEDAEYAFKTALENLKTADESISSIIKEQVVTAKEINDKTALMDEKLSLLEASEDRQEQIGLQYQLKADMEKIKLLQSRLEGLQNECIEVSREAQKEGAVKNNLKELFYTDPKKAIESLKKELPALANLSKADIKYLSTSKFVAQEYGKLLGVDNDRFAACALAQLENLKKVSSKNGMAVEIAFCEQWSEEPIFKAGSMLHPKEANRIMASAEKQIRGFKEKAEAEGDYYPYSKCSVSVYSANSKGDLSVLQTRIDIGDGGQKDMIGFLEQDIKRGKERKEIVSSFRESLKERPKVKLLLPANEASVELSADNKNEDLVLSGHRRFKAAPAPEMPVKEVKSEKTLSMEQWKSAMEKNHSKPVPEAQETKQKEEEQELGKE